MSEASKRWAKRNPEHKSKVNNAWNKRNPEKVRAARARYLAKQQQKETSVKLTPEQRRGIEERFAVLENHIGDDLEEMITTEAHVQPDWRVAILGEVAQCRDEVLTLVERLEPLLDGVDQ